MNDMTRDENLDIRELVAGVENQAIIMEILNSARGVVRDEHYGRDPHDLAPDDAANWRRFTPSYIAVLYLKMEADISMKVNHACFSIQANTEAGRLAQAVQVLEARGNGTFGDLDPQTYNTYVHQYNNAGHDPNRPRDSEWFADFNFASQNELFIYIDNPNISLEPGDLLSFKIFGKDYVPRSPNYSYFHARAVDTGMMGTLTGKMIRVENYVTKEDGGLIGAEQRRYAMNIKFRSDARAAGKVVMLIDPDTGNGAGNEP